MTRTFLLGAGASVDAGVPSATAMLKEIYNSLKQQRAELQRAVNVAIGGLQFQHSVVSADPFGTIDIEDVYAALLGLSKRHESFLSPFVGAWSSAVVSAENPSPGRVGRNFASAVERYVTRAGARGRGSVPFTESNWLKRATVDLVKAVSGARELSLFGVAAEQVLAHLVQLCRITERDKVTYLQPLVKQGERGPVWIATLNYDNTVELAADELGVSVDVGLHEDGSVELSPDGVTHCVSLAKLHGSVDWIEEDSTVRRSDAPFVSGPSLIFGSGNKLRPDGPYLDLLFAFRARLRVTNELHVCGYSFRDAHVNHFVFDWLERDEERQIHIHDPSLAVEAIGEAFLTMRPRRRDAYEAIKQRLQIDGSTAKEWLASFDA